MIGWMVERFVRNYAVLTENITEVLKKAKKWNWTEDMEVEIIRVKEELRNMRELKIPYYNREFRLRTDACDTGIAAILLQTNKDGKWVPIQWPSKKLKPTERRYEISEKEMLAVVWGIKKFEYEIRGRRFDLMTDHKALEEIKKNPYFKNNRINRWIEKIQEFDFSIECVKGEFISNVDALSRQYKNEKNKIEVQRELKMQKHKEWKENKHVKWIERNKIWKFSSGKRAIISEIEERNKLIHDIHDELNHRGVKGTYYKLK